MAQSNEHDVCHRYLLSYIEDRRKALAQQEMKLDEQSTLCPIVPVPFDRIDRCLREFVDGERNYLTKRNRKQLVKFKEYIQGKQLYDVTIRSSLTEDQVNANKFCSLFESVLLV